MDGTLILGAHHDWFEFLGTQSQRLTAEQSRYTGFI